jgi:charged multivesicular body protein 3
MMTSVLHVLQRQAVAEGVDDDDEDLEEIRARLAKVRS